MLKNPVDATLHAVIHMHVLHCKNASTAGLALTLSISTSVACVVKLTAVRCGLTFDLENLHMRNRSKQPRVAKQIDGKPVLELWSSSEVPGNPEWLHDRVFRARTR